MLTSRLIDRRSGRCSTSYRNETQVVCTTLSHDLENDPRHGRHGRRLGRADDFGHPFMGPIGAARVGYIDGQYVINPKASDLVNSSLDLVVAGTSEGVLMVESEAKELSEEVMLGAVNFGFQRFQPVINAIIELAEQAAKEPWPLKDADPTTEAVLAALKSQFGDKLAVKPIARPQSASSLNKIAVKGRQRRRRRRRGEGRTGRQAVQGCEKDIVRGNILKTGMRIDGRDTKTVRQIIAEVGVLPAPMAPRCSPAARPRAWWSPPSAPAEDEQIIDALEGEYRENFMLHYNFPPYSTGETGRMGSPEPPRNRPWQAGVAPFIRCPGEGKFPYTMRVVSEITADQRFRPRWRRSAAPRCR